MEDNNLDTAADDDQEVQNGPNYLSDVIEVIATDPDFRESTRTTNNKMFNGGGEIKPPAAQNPPTQPRSSSQAHIRIVEQPASKALRFRYECEGRSAGSIPGASSTPENKTFPTIQVMGYQGRAVVVVSCVTKDPPYRPHPHNLVGREGCKRGVCTIEIPTDTMTVHFSNLGIQCVKKKDIEHALKVREEIRVDPFRTGFSHRNQPTTIDLNTVRLCFQVFLEGDTPGKFSKHLTPVVSEPIYDKKAMSDLSIVKLSQCFSYVDGGRNDIILLCEKVAKEDIQVRFYEDNGDWEAYADFQPSQVHKQHAIWFQTPRYKNLDVTEPVKVLIQLRRPSDGATSESLPFELLPGRTPYWSYKRHLTKKANYNLFNSILANDAKLVAKRQLSSLSEQNEQVLADKNMNILTEIVPTPQKVFVEVPMETNNNQINTENLEQDYSEIKKQKKDEIIATESKIEEKSFNELINQVAELDEIYSNTQVRLLNEALNDIDQPALTNVPYNESFDDAKTYSSLQLAFKNPVEIELANYEDVTMNSTSPIINISPKRENDNEKLPPLPPKRTKKIETYIGGSMASVERSNSTRSTTTVGRSQSFSLQRPKSQMELSPPVKHLPPTPNFSTLPNPKKRGFFSKLFGRKSKTPGHSRETSVAPSTKSLQTELNLGKSTGNISTHSSASIRIPLKDSPRSSAQNLPELVDKNVGIVANEEVEMQLDLTEAEHYALYTAMAPHATQTPRRKRPKMDNPSQILRDLQGHTRTDQFPMSFPMDTIKTEPRETSTSPYHGSQYSGMSPGYVPNIGTSPLYNISFTPTPPDAFQYTRQSPQFVESNTNQELCPPSTSTPVLPNNWTVFPEANNAQKVTWNIPTASSQAETNVLFNLDTGNSEEIEMFVKSTTTHSMALPILQLSSEIGAGLDAEMTDSLTKLANFTLDNIMNH